MTLRVFVSVVYFIVDFVTQNIYDKKSDSMHFALQILSRTHTTSIDVCGLLCCCIRHYHNYVVNYMNVPHLEIISC